jgi:hypothetical protein
LSSTLIEKKQKEDCPFFRNSFEILVIQLAESTDNWDL